MAVTLTNAAEPASSTAAPRAKAKGGIEALRKKPPEPPSVGEHAPRGVGFAQVPLRAPRPRDAVPLDSIATIRTVGGSGASSFGANNRLATSDTAGGQVPTPAPAPGVTPPPPPVPTGPAPQPTLALSNNSYNDTGNVSHKNIGFDVTIPAGLNAHDYCLVNKLQGSMKKADGTFWKVAMYGSDVDFNFPSEQVDSVDADPVYWSNSGARWAYNSTGAGFGATDDPGPPGKAFAPGDVAAVKFHIGVYLLSAVPTTTTGSISTAPFQELPWQYSVVADAAGALSHPTL